MCILTGPVFFKIIASRQVFIASRPLFFSLSFAAMFKRKRPTAKDQPTLTFLNQNKENKNKTKPDTPTKSKKNKLKLVDARTTFQPYPKPPITISTKPPPHRDRLPFTPITKNAKTTATATTQTIKNSPTPQDPPQIHTSSSSINLLVSHKLSAPPPAAAKTPPPNRTLPHTPTSLTPLSKAFSPTLRSPEDRVFWLASPTAENLKKASASAKGKPSPNPEDEVSDILKRLGKGKKSPGGTKKPSARKSGNPLTDLWMRSANASAAGRDASESSRRASNVQMVMAHSPTTGRKRHDVVDSMTTREEWGPVGGDVKVPAKGAKGSVSSSSSRSTLFQLMGRVQSALATESEKAKREKSETVGKNVAMQAESTPVLQERTGGGTGKKDKMTTNNAEGKKNGRRKHVEIEYTLDKESKPSKASDTPVSNPFDDDLDVHNLHSPRNPVTAPRPSATPFTSPNRKRSNPTTQAMRTPTPKKRRVLSAIDPNVVVAPAKPALDTTVSSDDFPLDSDDLDLLFAAASGAEEASEIEMLMARYDDPVGVRRLEMEQKGKGKEEEEEEEEGPPTSPTRVPQAVLDGWWGAEDIAAAMALWDEEEKEKEEEGRGGMAVAVTGQLGNPGDEIGVGIGGGRDGAQVKMATMVGIYASFLLGLSRPIRNTLASSQANRAPSKPTFPSDRAPLDSILSLDFSEPQQPEKVVRLFEEAEGAEKYVLLREDWWHTDVGVGKEFNPVLDTLISPPLFSPIPGDTVHVLGRFDPTTSTLILSNTHPHLLILHPDVLISSALAADSFHCLRKAVLEDRVRTTGESSEPMVRGQMLHQLLQFALVEDKWSAAELEEEVGRVVVRNVEGLWAIGLEEEVARKTIMDMVGTIREWARKFVGKGVK
ncbi:DNA replication factor Dna2-domain-containing protein, partial [Jimgerdemannia flammicorona]